MLENQNKLIILGWTAGYAAGIYAARLTNLIIKDEEGGQLTTTMMLKTLPMIVMGFGPELGKNEKMLYSLMFRS